MMRLAGRRSWVGVDSEALKRKQQPKAGLAEHRRDADGCAAATRR